MPTSTMLLPQLLAKVSRQFGTSFIRNNVFMEILKLECRTKNTTLLFLSINFIFPCDQRLHHVNIFHSLLNHECLSYTNFFLGLVWFGFTLIFGECLNSLLCVTTPWNFLNLIFLNFRKIKMMNTNQVLILLLVKIHLKTYMYVVAFGNLNFRMFRGT